MVEVLRSEPRGSVSQYHVDILNLSWILVNLKHTTDTAIDRHRQTDRQTNRQTNRQTDKQTDRQTDRQTNRQTDKQTEIDRQSDTDRTGSLCFIKANTQTDRHTQASNSGWAVPACPILLRAHPLIALFPKTQQSTSLYHSTEPDEDYLTTK